ncbi:MAG: disulfide bond formation protein B [Hyphomicrobiaceae bacterium]|nr:MAG: disulfide bond formation protein B [Hyphomicrobiaceae bacterium]
MLSDPSSPLRSPAYQLGSIVLFAATAVILMALAFEYLGGYEPCPLCLQQRYAYYGGIPLLFAALVLVSAERAGLAALLFLMVTLAFLVNAGLGIYQAGAEWKFWPGPATCAAVARPLSTSAGGLFKDLENTRVIRCDEASWRLFGLSFAGWNAVISLGVALGSAAAALKVLRAPR